MKVTSRRTSRRSFLEQSARGAAVFLGTSSFGPLLALGAPKGGSEMKIGLVTYLWGKDWDLPTLVGNCEKSGVLAVELRTTHAHGVEPSLSPKERKEVKKRFEDSRVTLLGPGSNENFDNPDPAKLKRAIEATKEFVKLSYDVGGSGVKVKPNSFHKGVPREKTIEQIGKSLKKVGKFAADYGQEIRLEVHGQCSPLPIMKQIMDFADHPNVAVCWNSNEQDREGKGLEYNFNLVQDRFGKTAHVRELNKGSYPYQQLIDLFVKMDYDGWICLECRETPKDRVAALSEQRRIFDSMRAKAQGKK